MLEKLYKVMDEEILEKFQIDVLYIKLECLKHNYSWGRTVHRNQLRESELKCQYCLQEEKDLENSNKVD